MRLKLLKIYESVLTGLKEIRYNKLRSFLTMLGIMLGVASLVCMASIIEGAKKTTLEIMDEYGGLNSVKITYAPSEDLLDAGVYKLSGITPEDIEALKENDSDLIKAISSEITHSGYALNGANRLRMRVIHGADIGFTEVNRFKVEYGRSINSIDNISRARVAVIGTIPQLELFPGENPEDVIGQRIDVDSVSFEIVGIFSNYTTSYAFSSSAEETETNQKKDNGLPQRAITTNKRGGNGGRGDGGGRGIWRKYGENNPLWRKNYTVVIPLSTMQTLFREDLYLDTISLLLTDTEDLKAYSEKIKQTLLEKRGLEDFEIETQAENYEAAEQQLKIFNLVLGSIAAISLLVGGIGIMNVILASISERIREIGIRKSVGASDLDIFIQFLIETIVLAFMGGIFGIFASFIFVNIISSVSQLSTSISFPSIILALSFSFVIGVTFGIYPAFKAAKLNPINALRYE